MYAVIDIGSNTIRLVVYKVKEGALVPMLNKKYPAGLAGYIDEKNNLSDEGLERALSVLLDIEEILEHMKIKEIYPVATASLRNISNSEAVLAVLDAKTTFDIKVLSGEQEATYDFYGALHGLPSDCGVMVDVGGGSTEMVFFKNHAIDFVFSLPIGSLNLYEKYVDGIIPEKKEIAQIEKDVKSKLDALKISRDKKDTETICAVGGTARAAQKLICKCQKTQYKANELQRILDKTENDTKKVVKQILKTSTDRIHTIIPGIIVMNVISKYFKCDSIFTSDFGVREGYLEEMLKQKGEI